LLGKVCCDDEKQNFIHVSQKYSDVFAWNYEDLKGFDPDAKLACQRQRTVNPKIEPLMRKELTKLIQARIIFPIKYSTWVANSVPVRRKNGVIRLCMDFYDLNRASLKDH